MNFINLKQMNDEMKATDWSFFHQKSLKTTATTTSAVTTAAATSTTALTETAIDSYKLPTSRKLFDDFFQNSLFSNNDETSVSETGDCFDNGVLNGPSGAVTNENQKETADAAETALQPPTGVSLLHNYIGRRLACATSTTVNDSLSAAPDPVGDNISILNSPTASLPIVSGLSLTSSLVSLPALTLPPLPPPPPPPPSTLPPTLPQPFVPSPFDDHDNNVSSTCVTTATSTCRKTPIPNKFIDLFELSDYFDMTTPAGSNGGLPLAAEPAPLTLHDTENSTAADVNNCAAFLFNNLFENTNVTGTETTSCSEAGAGAVAVAATSDFIPVAAAPFDDFDNDSNSDLIKCFSSQSLINLVTSRDDNNVPRCETGGECSGLITPPSPAPHTFSLSNFLDDFSLVDETAVTAAVTADQASDCVPSGCDAGNEMDAVAAVAPVAETTTTMTATTATATATPLTPATNNPFFLHSNNHIMSSHQVSNVIKDICFTLKNTKKIDKEESTAMVTDAEITAPPTVPVQLKPVPPPRLSNGGLKSPIWVPRYAARDNNALDNADDSAAIVHANGNDYDNENESDDDDDDDDDDGDDDDDDNDNDNDNDDENNAAAVRATDENERNDAAATAAAPIERDANGNNTSSGSNRIVNDTGDASGSTTAHTNHCDEDIDTDLETDRLLGEQRSEQKKLQEKKQNVKNKTKNVFDAAVLEKGVSFVALYLGSTQIPCKGQPTKSTRMLQAEEAVSRIKAPEGETQPNTEVDLFISTKKIMVLNKKPGASGTILKDMQNSQIDRKNSLIMEHDLRTISYIADIGKLVVLMARRKITPHEIEDTSKTPSTTATSTTETTTATTATAATTTPTTTRTPKMICHIFESKEGFTNEKAQRVAQTIGQSFQLAYMSFLQENGIEDNSFVKEMDYQEVLNSQEIFGNELNMFAKKELQKEVIVPKAKNEILGVVIVESGWGSMLPTVVIANLAPLGPAFRCSQLNIGDQIIAINGISLVGLPLSTCQAYIKQTRHQSVVKLTVVPCAPVVEVKIKRPDTKYQLGFSVQNGVICSLLRGGIAERGGVRVGHRIIEINNQSVVAVPHEKIVNILATSVGEILMKTMPTSMFRLLTGQENPIYI